MRAVDRPDYAAELQYLADVLRVVDRTHEVVVATGFSGGADGPATAIRRGLSHEQLGLDRVSASPYFGRIHCEDEILYIGYRGLRERGAAGQRLVIDWRAPMARLFYEPEPEVQGRRRYVITERQLQDIADVLLAPTPTEATDGDSPEQPASDPFLLSVLATPRGRQMRDIVPTIQAEQYRLVRADASITVIQGAPGSGKTIVALHRLAYMLRQVRERRDGAPASVAIFGPNRLFLHYISAVLPDLGEREALHTTFEDWFVRWSGEQSIRFASREAELEQMLDSARPHRERAMAYRRARLKGSLRMGQVIQQRVENLRREALASLVAEPLSVRLADGGKSSATTLDKAALDTVVRRLDQAPLNVQREQARGELWTKVESLLPATDGSADKTSDSGLPTPRQAKAALEAEFDRRWPRHSFLKLYRDLITNEGVLCGAAHRLLKAEEQRILLTPTDTERHPASTRHQSGEPQTLRLEDVAPLSYACLLLQGTARGPSGPQTFHHVVIDEAQDLAPLQFLVLHAHAAQMTILGDMAQGIYSYRGVKAWDELAAVFPDQPILRAELRHSYRATSQLVTFANSILELMSMSAVTPALPFPRDGERPVLRACRNEAEMAMIAARMTARYLEQRVGRVAIICKTSAHAEQFGPRLREAGLGRFTTLTNRNSGYATEIVLLPAYLAKGMEFEAVIIVGASAQRYSRTEYDAKLLYIAVTRALHRLCILWDGEPSPLLPATA